MPQEIEVWYLIPALRREIAKTLIIKHRMSQKKAATLLGMTEPAISQYLSNKRGNDMKFSKQEIEEIEKTTLEIIKNPAKSTELLYKLSATFRGHECVCKMHRKHNPSIGKGCKMCTST